jgi:hypothetical protein
MSFYDEIEQVETLALLKILVLGSREIEQGLFRPVEDIFAELNMDN